MLRVSTRRAFCAALAGGASLIAVACRTASVVPITADTPMTGNSFVVRDVRVFDGERVRERADVVVKDGRIVSVGRNQSAAGLPVIDGKGRTLLPGFIDAHGHVPNATGLRDAARFGVTTVMDMLTRIQVVQAHKSQRTRMDRTDLADIYSAGSPITSPNGLGTQFGIPFTTLSGPGDARAFVKSRIAEGSDYIKILYEPGAPLFTTISRETLEAVVAAAHAEGVMAVAHVSSRTGALDAVRSGADGLAHGFSDTLLDESLAKEMVARRVFVIPTLSILAAFQAKPIGPSLAADSRVAPYLTAAQKTGLVSPGPGPEHPMAPYLVRFKIDVASENVRRMKEAGVPMLAGTDAPNLGSFGISLHGEMELLTRAGLTPAEALRAATMAPAKAFGLNDRGQIKAGNRADLVLVEGNPLQDIQVTRAIVRVFKNGYEVARSIPPASRP
jgi:imidazolonepropionase-like amidohydrolase